MPLTIISRTQLRQLLLSLTRDEVVELQQNLSEALREYSTGSQDNGCAATYQPQRTAITRSNGCTTIFMPATTGDTLGIKMISLQDGAGPGCAVARGRLDPNESGSVSSSSRRDSIRHSVASLSSQASDLSLGSSVEDEDSINTPATSTTSSSVKEESLDEKYLPSGCVNAQRVVGSVSSTMGAWPSRGARDTTPRGSLTLLDAESLPFGLINAYELTAFRTALASLTLFNKRKKVKTLLVFGAGTQAYWHIRLALILRGDEIRRVYIVNRSFERAAELLRDIYLPENTAWRRDVKFSAVSSDFGEYHRILKAQVRKADAIFCCTPSVDPLFPAEHLTAREGRQKGRFICAVGSYKSHMTEIHPDILRDEVTVTPPHRHFHKHTKRSGVVVVDSLDASLREAGEITQADIQPHQVVELGELMMVRHATQHAGEGAHLEDTKSLREWIERGNLIYKSVGLGLMDLVTGGDLVRLARARGVGTTVDDF